MGMGGRGRSAGVDFVESILAIAGGPSALFHVNQASDAGGLADLSGNGNGATSAGADAAFSPAGGPGGKPGLSFSGAQFYNFVTSITSNNLTAMAALVQGSAAVDQCLLGTQSSARAFLLRRSGQVAIYDSAFRLFGAVASGPQILTWKLNTADGGSCEMRRNGASLGTDTYDGTFWPFQSGSRLGSLAGGSWPAVMVLSAVAVWESALTPTEQAAADAAFSKEYPVS